MREWWSKVRAVVRRRRIDDDLQAELDAHLQMEVDAQVDRGLSEADARAAARRQFGNRTRIEESSREAWMFTWIETLVQDVRYGARLLRRSPGFTLTAVLVIALGVGANTASFTLLDHVLLRPLPFADPGRLVMLYETQLERGVPRTQTSPPNYVDWRSMSQSFESMGAYMAAPFAVNLSGHGEPLRLDSILINSEMFRTLGVDPIAGRWFTADDDRVGADNVVVLSSGVARGLFGDPASAVGRSINLDNQPHAIVGVMPANFAFPSRNAQIWRPLRLSPPMMALRSNHLLYAVARMRPDVTLDGARADMNVIATRLQREYPKDNAVTGIGVVYLRDMLSPQWRTLVLAIFGASICLMLIACTNLANLLFARAMVRRHEVAVRLAIGAGRQRLFRQLLTESVMLSIIGGAVGLLLAVTAIPLLALAHLVPTGLGLSATPELNWRVFTFAATVVLLTGIAFSIGPAWRSLRVADAQALRSRSPIGGRSERVRSLLVLAEVTGTVVLLVAAGLLVKALWRVQALDPGFRTTGVLTLRTALPAPKYGTPAARRDFYTRVLERTRALPGVSRAAYVSYQPMEAMSGRWTILAPGVADDPLSAPQAVVHFVTPGFFDALGIPIQQGRDFNDQDTETAQPVTVISASLAERFWPGQNAIGRQVNVSRVDRVVVGVAGSISVRSLESAIDPQIYFPSEQLGNGGMYYAPRDLVVQTSGEALAMAPAVLRIIRDVDPDQAISDVRRLSDVVRAQTAPRRDSLIVLGVVAAIAFVLAGVGIHGLLLFTVSSRTQEIGVRVALGAARGTILRMFLRQGLWLGVGGTVVALPLAHAAARGLESALFGVSPRDPLIYAGAAAVTVAMTLLGSLRPAVRAAVIDPALTMRAE